MASIFEDDDDWADWFTDDEADKELDKTEFKYVLGLDPGGTTGLALFRYTDETLPELVYLDHIEGGTIGYYDYFFETFLEKNLTVVSEKWVERNIKGSDHTPCYIEGVQLAQWGQNRVLYQTPDQKSGVPDERLKEQHLWVPQARHAMDATIHVLVYLKSIKHKPTLLALTGTHLETIGEDEDSESKFGGGGSGEGQGGFDQAVRAALAELGEDGDPGDGEGDGEGSGDDGEGQGQTAQEGNAGDDEHGTGSTHGDFVNYDNADGDGIVYEKDDGKKRRRLERNGVFVGWAPEGEEKELFSD